MSYQVLARKWRPYQFNDVVGQSHVLTALSNALDHNRLHHAYLFSGTRGVGKTTIARIFAKGLNCEQGITSSPCGQCQSCQEVEQGRFVDLLEIDAASRTKVEDTRELLDNVQYKPARGRFKVYLIDEVHMLSRNSFNALLKTLEEPPEYVKFLLATTDPQKLPITILSRCLQFNLKHLSGQQIQQQLEHVLSAESIAAENRALSLIARAAEGSMRDALSLTDQAIALGNGAVIETQVIEMLGTLSTDQAILLLEALAEGQADPVMKCVTALAEIGVEWDGLLKEIAAQLHQIAMLQALPEMLDKSSPDAPRLMQLSQLLAPQDVQLFYQIVLQGRQDLPLAPDGRAGLEMVLLRMLAFRPVSASAVQPTPMTPPSQANLAGSSNQSHSATQQDGHASGMAGIEKMRAQMVTDSKKPVDPNGSSQLASSVDMTHSVSTKSDTPVNHAQEIAPQPQQVASPQPEVMSSQPEVPQSSPPQSLSANQQLLNAQNMLRSRMRQGQSTKKTEPVSSTSTAQTSIERITSRYKNVVTGMATSAMPEPQESSGDDAYRWQPTQSPIGDVQEVEISTEQIKVDLQHEITPEMRLTLTQESLNKDEWNALVAAIDVVPLVRQIALNAAMVRDQNKIHLHLRESQQHLNTEKAQDALKQALETELQAEIELVIEVSVQGITPLEWRDKIYQEKLVQAHQSLQNDPNVHFLSQRFSAALDDASIRPI